MQWFMSNKSIRTRFLAAGLIICLVALSIAAVTSYLFAYTMLKNETVFKIREVASNYANQVNNWFVSQGTIVKNAGDNIILNNNYDSQYLQRYLNHVYLAHQPYVRDCYLGFTTNQRLQFVSGNGWVPPADFDCRQRDWYQLAAQHRHLVYTAPYVDLESGKMVITVAYPLIAKDKLIGVIGSDILIENVCKIVTQTNTSIHGYGFLLDNHHNILTHPNPAFIPKRDGLKNIDSLAAGKYRPLLQLVNQPARTTALKDYDGTSRLFVMHKIKATGWALGYAIDEKQYLQPLQNLLWGFVITFIISILIGGLILIYVIGGLIKPLHLLHHAVKRYTARDFTVRAAVTTKDEIGDLSKSFNQMASTIQEYSQHLEQMVEDRTQEVKEKTSKIIESIEYAKMIQESILPDFSKYQTVLQEHFLLWRPREAVGGDFYWAKEQDGMFACAVIDCTGHGVPGALMTMTVNSVLNRVVEEIGLANPGHILQEVNRILRETLHQDKAEALTNDGAEIGLCVVQKSEGKIIFAGAGLTLFAVINHKLIEVKGDRQRLGYKQSQPDYRYTNHPFPLTADTIFYLTTDGLLDQKTEARFVAFGKKRLRELIIENSAAPLAAQLATFTNELDTYQGNGEQLDDITLLAVKF